MPALLAVIYAAFISLGLPDNVLGSAWPQMALDFGANIAAAGILSLITSCGTIISSFSSGWILKRFSTPAVSIASTLLTVISLFAFSVCPIFALMPICALLLGLGAGAIDSALNAYVSRNYSAMHMNFLHAFWGVGAMCGPFIVGFCLFAAHSWRPAYAAIAAAQLCLAIILIYTRHLWPIKSRNAAPSNSLNEGEIRGGGDAHSNSETCGDDEAQGAPEAHETSHLHEAHEKASAKRWYSLPLIWSSLIAFLCYCGAESSAMLWGSTFLKEVRHLDPAIAAAAGGAFVIGITAGRFISGIATKALRNVQLMRIGTILLILGMIFAVLTPWALGTIIGFAAAGLGSAPMYPAIMKELGRRFGKENINRVIGVHMGFAYIGSLLFPPITGLLIAHISPLTMPLVPLCSALGMLICHEWIERRLSAADN